ncbi:MAG: hypothetical protein SFV81_27405 [Pirellulaceae bacterium]|nr:hypothetical protein [Pirellulaceae bacterium]
MQQHHSQGVTTAGCPDSWHVHWVFPVTSYAGLATDSIAIGSPADASQLEIEHASSLVSDLGWAQSVGSPLETAVCQVTLQTSDIDHVTHFHCQESLLEQFCVMSC